MLQRAYSLLTIKSVDGERRMLSGMATTPSPDRIGDVVEPLGVKFKNPLPLLLFHDHTRPVGTVKFSKPTDEGIAFEASIPSIDEPGSLRDRVDEAWQSVKAGLVKGVSIGFRVLDDGMELLRTGGVRFTRTEVLELSLVTVPANAEAVIATIKSLDAPHLAASGMGAEAVARPSAGGSAVVVRASKPDAKSMKTIAEQIESWSSQKTATLAQRDALMNKTAETGVLMSDEETAEYDEFDSQIKKIDAHLVRLKQQEQEVRAVAKPVVGETIEKAAASRSHESVIRVKDALPPGIEFARYAMCVMMAKGNLWQAQEIAKARFPDQPRILNVIKAAVAAGTTTDATWAGSLVDYQNFTSDFIDFLRPSTIIGKFGTGNIPSLQQVPFNIRILGQTSGGSGYWVGQGKPKPLTKFDFAATTMTWAKVAAISVLAEELVRFSNPSAEMLVRNALRDALIERLDTDFVDPDKGAVANVSPASITNNVAPITSAGSSAADVRVDLMNLMAPFISANTSPAGGVFIMSQTRALALSLMQNALGQPENPNLNMMGGTFQGFPVITSQYVVTGSPASDLVIFVNAPDIYLADDGQVVIDASREASLEMSDAPTQNGAAGTGASLVSLWQNNLLGLRAERFINWSKRRPGAVAYLENVTWGAGGGSPA